MKERSSRELFHKRVGDGVSSAEEPGEGQSGTRKK